MLSHFAAAPCICSVPRYFHAPPSLNLPTKAICCRQKKSKIRFSLISALPFDLSPPPIDLDPLVSPNHFNHSDKLDWDLFISSHRLSLYIVELALSYVLCVFDVLELYF